MRTILIALLALGCSTADPATPEPAPSTPVATTASDAPDAPDAEPSPAATASDRTLLFFLNPNGRPCQIQQGIFAQMGDSLTVPVEEVSVLDNANRPTLYQYGVRSLPALILVDGSGAELHRFTPGIQQADAVIAALD